MTGRSVKSLTISLPLDMIEELDRLSHRQHRSRSELLREAFRCYAAGASEQQILVVDPEPDELEALEQGRAETARGEYVPLEDLLDELDSNRRTRRGEKS